MGDMITEDFIPGSATSSIYFRASHPPQHPAATLLPAQWHGWRVRLTPWSLLAVQFLSRHARVTNWAGDLVNFRFYIDPETGEPHIYEHGVTEEEVEEVLRHSADDFPGRRNSRISLGV